MSIMSKSIQNFVPTLYLRLLYDFFTPPYDKLLKSYIGRMRTRINPGKFNELNEYGIFHLSTLLLCISNLKPEETTSQEIARDLLKVTFNKASCSSLSSRSPIFQLSTIFHLNNSKDFFYLIELLSQIQNLRVIKLLFQVTSFLNC